jgi:hypothetical protein
MISALQERFYKYDRVPATEQETTRANMVVQVVGLIAGSFGCTAMKIDQLFQAPGGWVGRYAHETLQKPLRWVIPIAEIVASTATSVWLDSGKSWLVRGLVIAFHGSASSFSLAMLRNQVCEAYCSAPYTSYIISDQDADLEVDKIIMEISTIFQSLAFLIIFRFEKRVHLAQSIAKGGVSLLSYPFYSTKGTRIEQISAVVSLIAELALRHYTRNIYVILMVTSVASHVITGIAISHLTRSECHPWVAAVRRSLSFEDTEEVGPLI